MAKARGKLTVREVDKGFLHLRRVMRTLESGAYAMAGVAESRDKRAGEDISNSDLTVIHEFGAPAANIPARPFMRPSFDRNRAKYGLQLARGARRIYEGRTDPLRLLALLGTTMASDMKAEITKFSPIPPPNAPAVRARKLARMWRTGGFGGVRTLVDTGRMVNSIGHAVVFSGKTVGVRIGGSKGAQEFRIPNPKKRRKAKRRAAQRRRR